MEKNLTRAAVAAAWLLATAFVASAASDDFEGTWDVKDMSGNAFQIVLSSDGVAKATRGDGMAGTWKEEEGDDGDAAVITWDTGWVTKIVEADGKYSKTAYHKGQPLDGPPANSSDAEKVK